MVDKGGRDCIPSGAGTGSSATSLRQRGMIGFGALAIKLFDEQPFQCAHAAHVKGAYASSIATALPPMSTSDNCISAHRGW
jgi:hypothetical protein